MTGVAPLGASGDLPTFFTSPLWTAVSALGMLALVAWVIVRVARTAAKRPFGWEKGARLGWLPKELPLYFVIAAFLTRPGTLISLLDWASNVVGVGMDDVERVGAGTAGTTPSLK